MFKVGGFFRTPNKKNVFCKGDTTNWSDRWDTITENNDDTIRPYHKSNLPETNKTKNC